MSRSLRSLKRPIDDEADHKVKPGTPYNLILPYRTPELAWSVDQKLVKMSHVGEKANFEQIMFTEDSRQRVRRPPGLRARRVNSQGR